MLHARLDCFLERLEADPLRTLPRFVRRELEGYLACGVPGGGFARLRCDACGREELVYFSCKGRGFCPSCGGRRMADQAAHLVDRVLPHVPVRQWVFTLPWELRTLVAYNRKVLAAVRRIWWEELSRWLCRRGEEEGMVAPRPGAVNVIQRFDSALRLNVHFHTVVLSGVYAGEGEEALFHELPAPTPADLALILHKICFRLMDYLVRQGLLDPNGQPEADDHGPPSDEGVGLPAEFVAAAVAGRSVLGAEAASSWAARLGSDPQAEVAFVPDKRCVQVSGFTLYVSPSIAACARDRLEQVCRYVIRPPIATERLHLTPSGNVLYRFKRPWKDGTHSILLEPLAFIERLAALVPPPRRHLLTYHGVLAAAALGRERIIPEPPREEEPPLAFPPQGASSTPIPRPPRRKTKRYYPWADLLRRVFGTEVFCCPHCGGRRRLVSFITEPEVIERILTHLGIVPWPKPPPLPERAG